MGRPTINYDTMYMPKGFGPSTLRLLISTIYNLGPILRELLSSNGNGLSYHYLTKGHNIRFASAAIYLLKLSGTIYKDEIDGRFRICPESMLLTPKILSQLSTASAPLPFRQICPDEPRRPVVHELVFLMDLQLVEYIDTAGGYAINPNQTPLPLAPQ